MPRAGYNCLKEPQIAPGEDACGAGLECVDEDSKCCKFADLGMNELDIYIPPNIRLISSISKQFTIIQRFTSDKL